MADSELSALTEDTAPAATDWFYKVDSAGTVDRKVAYSNVVPAASDTVAGVARRATQAETDAGAATDAAVSPSTLRQVTAGNGLSEPTPGQLAIDHSYPVIRTPTTLSAITAVTATISHATPITLITADANYIMTAAPLISDGTDGETLTIINVDSQDRITLQDQAILASSNIRLSTPQLELYPRSSVTLVYSSSVGDWVEVGRSKPDFVQENMGSNHVRWSEAFASISVTSGSIGSQGWRSELSGTDASIVHGATFGFGTTKTIQPGTTTTGRASLFLGALASEGAELGGMISGSRVGMIAWRQYHSALSTAAQEYITRIGILDEVDGTEPADGYYFEYDRLTAGDFWRIVTANNSTRTKTTTTIAPSAGGGVNQTLRVDYDAAAVRFYIDGVLAGTHTTNIYATNRWATPAASIRKTAGTTTRNLDVSACAIEHRID